MNTYKKRENVENVHSGKMDSEPPNQNFQSESRRYTSNHTTQKNTEEVGLVFRPMQKIQESLSTGTDSTTGFPVSYHQATRQWKVY